MSGFGGGFEKCELVGGKNGEKIWWYYVDVGEF